MHKVSVIIPVYNVEEYLPKCLDSIVNQTYKNLEIVCVNDCSPDNCDKILQDYANRDKRIKIVNREKNGGLSAARNTGMDAATGEYIYFIDSDDWIDLDYIEQMVIAALDSNVEIVLNTSILFHENELEPVPFTPNNTQNFVQNKFLNAQSCIFNIIWNTWAYLWKKSFLDRIRARFPEGYVIEDMYFQATTLPFLDKIYVIRKSNYHYIKRESSICGKLSLKQDSSLASIKIVNKVADFYIKNKLLDSLKAKIIIFPAMSITHPCRKEIFEQLRILYLKVKNNVYKNKSLYEPTQFKMFDDIVNNYEKALVTDYCKIFMLNYLHKNVKRDICHNV